MNNIPMTLAFASAAGGLSGMPLLAAALGTAIGSNLGANLTPIGALAGIMWMTILSDREVRITFPEFMKYGLLVTPASLLACLGVLALQVTVGGCGELLADERDKTGPPCARRQGRLADRVFC